MLPAVVVGVIVLGILLGQKVVVVSSSALLLSAVIVTNTVYETFLMFLLGYALVEFPRAIWDRSNLDKYLLKIQMKAAAEFKDIADTQLNVSLVVADVLKTQKMVSKRFINNMMFSINIITHCLAFYSCRQTCNGRYGYSYFWYVLLHYVNKYYLFSLNKYGLLLRMPY